MNHVGDSFRQRNTLRDSIACYTATQARIVKWHDTGRVAMPAGMAI